MSATPHDLAATMIRRAAARRAEDARDREACLHAVRRVLAECRGELGVDAVWIIGSLAWGNFGLRSDVDVVIDGRSFGADAVTRLGDRIGAATRRAVDVLVLSDLPETFRARVLAEGQHVP